MLFFETILKRVINVVVSGWSGLFVFEVSRASALACKPSLWGILVYVTGFWKTIPNRTFGILRNTNLKFHDTVFLWCLIAAMPDLHQK